MSSVPHPEIRFSYEDYKTLPESVDKRYELLDGDLVMVPAPSTAHQRVSRNLEFLLLDIVRNNRLGVLYYSPIDVVLGTGKEREVVQPDILFIRQERVQIVFPEEIRGAPDLVVEVLSPGTEERDRGYKKTLYGRYGVREYWILDPQQTLVEVYRPAGARMQQQAILTEREQLASPLLHNIPVDLSAVFLPD